MAFSSETEVRRSQTPVEGQKSAYFMNHLASSSPRTSSHLAPIPSAGRPWEAELTATHDESDPEAEEVSNDSEFEGEQIIATVEEFTTMAGAAARATERLNRELCDMRHETLAYKRKIDQLTRSTTELAASLQQSEDTTTQQRGKESHLAEVIASELALKGELHALKNENRKLVQGRDTQARELSRLESENKRLREEYAVLAQEQRAARQRSRGSKSQSKHSREKSSTSGTSDTSGAGGGRLKMTHGRKHGRFTL
ncbi:unnamed protein product [Chrysoparadoxa australica]